MNLIILAVSLSLPLAAQVKQDLKDAGHETAEAGKDVGHAAVTGTKKTGRAIKRTGKKTTHAAASATEKGAGKVKARTQ